MPERKVRVGRISGVSTDITDGPWLTFGGGVMALRYEFDRDELLYRAGVEFRGVRASRHRTESLCTSWHIKDSYDHVVQVEDSEWVAELAAIRPEWASRFPMNHFMLYLDSFGCLEVAAAGWNLVPEESAESGD